MELTQGTNRVAQLLGLTARERWHWGRQWAIVLEQGAAAGGARLRTWARALLTARSAKGGVARVWQWPAVGMAALG